jgi:apoptosis-inducing factor 3
MELLITLLRVNGMNKFTFLGWHNVARVADLAPGKVQARRVMGRLVGVVMTDSGLHVFDARCPHAGHPLQGEDVSSGGVVICPRHGLKLALDTAPCSFNAQPVTKFEFRVRDGIVQTKLSSAS